MDTFTVPAGMLVERDMSPATGPKITGFIGDSFVSDLPMALVTAGASFASLTPQQVQYYTDLGYRP